MIEIPFTPNIVLKIGLRFEFSTNRVLRVVRLWIFRPQTKWRRYAHKNTEYGRLLRFVRRRKVRHAVRIGAVLHGKSRSITWEKWRNNRAEISVPVRRSANRKVSSYCLRKRSRRYVGLHFSIAIQTSIYRNYFGVRSRKLSHVPVGSVEGYCNWSKITRLDVDESFERGGWDFVPSTRRWSVLTDYGAVTTGDFPSTIEKGNIRSHR